LLLLHFRNKGDHRGVEFPRERRVRRFFIDDSGAKRFVGLGECLDGGEDIGINRGWLDGAELGDREGQRGHELLVGVDDILGDFFVD